jgi:RHS repeat-associated protein
MGRRPIEYRHHPQHLDTPRVITDAAGNKVWEWQNIDPFGNNVPNENPSGQGTFVNPLRYPGQYADKETNLYYAHFRDCYDPATGRFCQSDPIGLLKQSVDPLFSAYNKPVNNTHLMGGINQLFIYAGENPISRKDPTGLEWDVPYFQQPGFNPNPPPIPEPIPLGNRLSDPNGNLWVNHIHRIGSVVWVHWVQPQMPAF